MRCKYTSFGCSLVYKIGGSCVSKERMRHLHGAPIQSCLGDALIQAFRDPSDVNAMTYYYHTTLEVILSAYAGLNHTALYRMSVLTP